MAGTFIVRCLRPNACRLNMSHDRGPSLYLFLRFIIVHWLWVPPLLPNLPIIMYKRPQAKAARGATLSELAAKTPDTQAAVPATKALSSVYEHVNILASTVCIFSDLK